MRVAREQAAEIGSHRWLAEASEVGLKPGEFPGQIETDIGNGQPFIRKRYQCNADGDVLVVEYWQAFGICQLHLIND